MTSNPYGKKQASKPADSETPQSVELPAETATQQEAEKNRQTQVTGRQMTRKRKIKYALFKPLILIIVNFIWMSCRVKIIGAENMNDVVAKQKPVIPCYWHQQHIFCGWYMLKQIKRGMKVGFLVSPSVDGEIPAKIVAARGASVIRGSSTRTGAQALRDMYQIITQQGISPVTTSDGPTGPIYKFKPGAVMLSQMTKAPMLPIACAAKSAWYLRSWDRFMIPKPFTRVVIAVGEPVYAESQAAGSDSESVALHMENSINALMKKAEGLLV